MSPETLIDLTRPGPAVAHRRHVGTGRLVLMTAMVALLGGGQPGTPGRLAELATVPATAAQALLLAPGRLVVVDDTGGSGRVSAFGLPGGARLWRVGLPGPVRGASLVAASGVLLAAVGSEPAAPDELLALDLATGGVRWALPAGSLVDATDGGQLLVRRQEATGVTALALVAASTGRLVWSRVIPADAEVTAGHDQDRPGSGGVMVTAVDGTATLLDERSGSVVARADVGSLVSNLVLTPGPDAAPTVLGGGLLVQHRRNAGAGSITAFDPGTLAVRWSLTGDLLGAPIWCAGLLCLGSGQGLRAVDPASGAVRWQIRRWQYASPLSRDRLLGYSVSGAGLAVLDAGTGATLLEVAAAGVRVLPTGGLPALLRSTGPDTYALASIDPERPALELIGTLTGVDGRSCVAAGPVVACQTVTGAVRVWRSRT